MNQKQLKTDLSTLKSDVSFVPPSGYYHRFVDMALPVARIGVFAALRSIRSSNRTRAATSGPYDATVAGTAQRPLPATTLKRRHCFRRVWETALPMIANLTTTRKRTVPLPSTGTAIILKLRRFGTRIFGCLELKTGDAGLTRTGATCVSALRGASIVGEHDMVLRGGCLGLGWGLVNVWVTLQLDTSTR